MSTNYIIKAPAVYDLGSLKAIIRSLEYTPIPYSYIDERRLCELENNEKISSETHQAINDWKESENIIDGKGVLQSIVSLLKSLGIVYNVSIEENELDQPMGFSGPILNTFLEKKTSAIKLTDIGYKLCELIQTNDDESNNMYENILFWRFLHSNTTHNFQKLIEDEDSYVKGVNHTLKKFERDSKSITLFRGWIKYFELTGIGSDNLVMKKVAKKIISVTILELNLLDVSVAHPIQTLSANISKNLDLSNTFINFFSVFEIILRQIQLSDEETKAIEGGEGQHGEKALPNFPRVNMLKINHQIQTQLVLNHVSERELQSVINTRD